MNRYLVYRYGANSFNQGWRWEYPLCIVEAPNRSEAIEIAEQYHEVYRNQYLKAVPLSKARRRDIDEIEREGWYYHEGKDVKKHPQILITQEPWIFY